MGTYVNLLVNIILPIFIMIFIGFIAQRKLKMDARTFTRINMYIFIPALLFVKIYETEITWQLFGNIVIFIAAISILMYVLGVVVSKIMKYPVGISKAFINSLLFFNSGNYGLPLVQLAFSNNAVAVTAQIFILLIQNVTSNTFGVFQACSGTVGTKKALKNVLAMPSLYVLLVVIPIKAMHVQVPEFVMMPLHNISAGFVAIALVTLGVQLADVKIAFNLKNIFASAIIRLVISPLFGVLLVYLLGVEGILAKSLIIGVATPAAVNTAIIAKEYNNEPEYASQIVFTSTILSAISIPCILYLLG